MKERVFLSLGKTPAGRLLLSALVALAALAVAACSNGSGGGGVPGY